MTYGTIKLDLTDMKTLAKHKETPSPFLRDEYSDVVVELSDGAEEWFERNGIAEWDS